ncbi:MAG TPA: hypothetical protein ENK64_03315 [Flavobacteriales bacterium]|nr:hypothetical protein [Flavobacteriales bacterium]
MFIRIHRSIIININHIDRIEEGYVVINNKYLSIGRHYHDMFFETIQKL